jgi:hypothetical protein
VAGLGFLAAFYPDAIAPASISTAFADAIAFSFLGFSRKNRKKQEKNAIPTVLLTLECFFSY